MKLKFKLITVFAALGVASTGFAAWNFATATSGEVNIAVGIEAAVGSIGTIDFDEIGTYNLADNPNPLVFKGKFNPASGINLAEVNLTYKVTLNSALADLIDFGSAAEGVWVSDVATSITPTWNAGKNPSDLAAYNAIKANLANLSMNVTLTASKKDGSDPIAPIEIVPGALPAGLVAGPGGLIEFDKDLGPVQLTVEGVDENGDTDGVAQNFNWTSSDPTRASVVDGLVTPLADGNVTITATAANPLGKGLKKAEGSAATYDFHFNIVGFTIIPPDPVATKIELVLGEGVTNEMALDIDQEINVSARVLDENDNVMPELIVEAELLDDESASYINGVLKALKEVEENTLLFSYEGLTDVYFDFSVNPAPKAEPAWVLINGGFALEVPFAQGSGTLVAEVYDADGNVLADEAVTWSVPNNDVISIDAETGAYTINGAGVVVVTAKSVTHQYILGTLQLTVLEPPVVNHNVTIIYGHGIANGSLTVEDGDVLEGKLTAPAVTGWTFSHWEVDGETLDQGDAVTSDLIITAVYTQNTYTVIFDTDGGVPIPAERNVAHGEVMVEPNNPEKDGYTFDGWWLGGERYQWATPVTSSFELKAHWNVIQYTITYDTGEGGSAVPSETINHGAHFTEPADPTREGYTFDGWLHEGVPFKFTDAVTGDVDLVAKWNPVGGGEVEKTTVTLAYEGDGTTNNYNLIEENNASVLGLDENIFEVTSELGSANQHIGLHNSGEIRVYSVRADGEGNTLSVNIAAGRTITKVVFNFASSSQDALAEIKADGEEIYSDIPNANSSLTFEDLAVSSFSIKNIHSGGSTNLQIRISSIVITYNDKALPPVVNLGSVIISSASGSSVEEKQSIQLNATVEDVDGQIVTNSSLVWESLNVDIATVGKNGLVSALVPGTAMIKVTATRRGSVVESQFAVTVTARPAGVPNKVVLVGYESVENPALSIALVTGTTSLSAKVLNQYNEEMTGVDLVWESSNQAVATVANGFISLVSAGNSVIKVSVADNSEIFSEIVLTVSEDVPQEETITINVSALGGVSVIGTSAYGGGAERTASIDGISFGSKAVTGNQKNTPSGANAGTYMQAQANNGVLYNTSSLGKITGITIDQQSTQKSTVYVGSSRLVNAESANYNVFGGTSLGEKSDLVSVWAVEGNFSYFAIKRGSSSAYWTTITITYIA